VIGIDEKAGREGDCLALVYGDGRELFQARLAAGDEGKPISVDITNCRHVDLEVRPGANLDIGDHLNWCDARFIR
jgi:hypothetical protein